MIIELSSGFSSFTNAKWEPYHRAVENLLIAHGAGWHMLALARNVADVIASECDLSKTQKQILDHYIRPKFSTLVGEARAADCTILAVEDNHSLVAERSNQIVIPLRRFSDPASCMAARLLTENAEGDGEYLKTLCRILARHLKYGTHLNLELIHGGGDTTAAVLDGSWNDIRPLLCVVDSDKRYPGASLGSTARAVQAIAGVQQNRTVEATILEVREMENLVPISFLLEVYKGNPAVNSVVSSLCNYLSHSDCAQSTFRVVDYVDLKEGILCSDVAKVPENIRDEFKKFCIQISSVNLNDIAFDNVEDDRQIFAGVSKNMLVCTIDFIARFPHLESEFARKIVNAPFWNGIEPLVRKILSFGAAGQRLPIRV